MEQVKLEVISLLRELENLPRRELNPPQQQKSLELAQKLREDGNQKYKSYRTQEDLQNVYQCYAESIAHAPANSQEMALAYANLSAVLFQLEKYSQCLQAIDCCLNSNYPEKSKFKIYLRKIKCLKFIDEKLKVKEVYDETLAWIVKNQTEADQKTVLKKELEDCYKKEVEVKKPFTEKEFNEVWEDFSIKTYNAEIPGASSAIRLDYNESQGKHYVATRDVRPGEIIMKERPRFMVCSVKTRYQSCWKCLKCMKNCIPCDFCKNVIFCSVKCKEDAWEEYHRQECAILSSFLNLPESKRREFDIFVMAFRVFLLAINEYGSVKRLKEVLDELDQSSRDPRTRGFTNGKLLDNQYIAFYSLESHANFDTDPALAAKMIYEVATTTNLLGKKFEPGTDEIHENEDIIFAACLIFKHMNIVKVNSYSAASTFDLSRVGTYLSIIRSLFNHSCVDNVRFVTTESLPEVIAILPIKKGEQLFINYFEGLDKTTMRIISQIQYHFICKCEACVNNWPPKTSEQYPSLMEQSLPLWIELFLEAASILPPNIDQGTIIDLDELSKNLQSRDFRMIILKYYSEYMNKLIATKPLPCNEVILMQELIFAMYSHLNNLKSLEKSDSQKGNSLDRPFNELQMS